MHLVVVVISTQVMTKLSQCFPRVLFVSLSENSKIPHVRGLEQFCYLVATFHGYQRPIRIHTDHRPRIWVRLHERVFLEHVFIQGSLEEG